jgi:DNA/RNA-binding protein KIN17
MRDENGFKCHTQSEAHVRQMILIGEDPRKYINDFSSQFRRDFLQLLRTAHGEKKVLMNHFYQEYIANKEHVHMNSTKWTSLTEFAKFLGREGICRVEETDKGLEIAWIDNSPENLRRQDAIRKKDRQDKGDEEREQRLIREQISRAKLDVEGKGDLEPQDEGKELKRTEGESIKLNFGRKDGAPQNQDSTSTPEKVEDASRSHSESTPDQGSPDKTPPPLKQPTKIIIPTVSKPKNVFSAMKKKKAGESSKGTSVFEQPKKNMSEAERIMKEELKRKSITTPSRSNEPPTKRYKIY